MLKILKCLRETFTDNEVSQINKDQLLIILIWFIIYYFQHNLDLISQARKFSRPQNDDKTILADKIIELATKICLIFCFSTNQGYLNCSICSHVSKQSHSKLNKLNLINSGVTPLTTDGTKTNNSQIFKIKSSIIVQNQHLKKYTRIFKWNY